MKNIVFAQCLQTIRLILMVLVVTNVNGCTSLTSLVSIETAKWPWNNNKDICKDANKCNEQEALTAFLKASNYCREVQNYYEKGGQKAKTSQVVVGTVGVLAGSVLMPISTGGGENGLVWAIRCQQRIADVFR